MTSYFLVIFFLNFISLKRGLWVFLFNRLGDIFFLLFIIFNNNNMSGCLLIFFLLSFTKRAQYPFNSWLVIAMEAPTPISALVHSSTLITAGACLIFFYNNKVYRTTLFLLSNLLTVVISSVQRVRNEDIKKIVAYSTLNQISLVFIFFFTNNYLLGLIYICLHAVVKSSLFINIG